jgi:CHAT domain-containing protein
MLAREGFALLRDVSREVGDTVSLGRALLNLAMVDLRLGDPLAAIASVDEARQLARSSADAEAEENALGQMATAFLALGQPQRAFGAIDSALALAEAHGLRRRVAEDLKLLGDFYAGAGDYRRALEQYTRAQAINVELGLPEDLGNTLRDEARSLRALGHADTAQARAERALAIHRAGGFRVAELDDQLLLTELASDRDDQATATRSIREATRISAAIGAPLPKARVAVGSARLHDRARRPTAVLAALDSAEGLPLLGEDERWVPDALRSRAYTRLGQLEAAEMAGRRATASIERIRAGYGSGALRTAYLSERSGVYADLVLLLLARGDTAAAFEVADAARGRALLEHLGAARREVEQGAGPAGDLLRGEQLLRRIDELTAQLRMLAGEPPGERGTAEVARTRSLEDRLSSARGEYEAFLTRVGMMTSAEATLLGAGRMTTAMVQQSLRPDELLVEYLVASDRIHLFSLGSHRISHTSRPIPANQLTSRVRLARELTSRPDGSEASGAVLRELHRQLIAPLEEEGLLSGVRRLIVVPQGSLAYLPFAALEDESGAPLVLRYSVMVLASAASLPALRNRIRPALAGGERSIALAPLPRELPASRTEAADVRRIQGGSMLIGSQATEAALRKALGTPAVVHVATHGVMNPVNPMFSRLELAPGREDRPEDDGRLEVHELLGLRVGSGLVYLSGCETAKGPAWLTGFEQGEDYVTLAQAFLYAGAGNVVATLWRVDDPGAAAFASRFYRAWQRNPGDPVEALAWAQREMLREPAHRAPYFWAAYQISGSGLPGMNRGTTVAGGPGR